MSLFRKPFKYLCLQRPNRKIQRRMFCADDDDEDGDPEPPPPPLISQKREKKENNVVKAPKLLSFADEEEDCEEFKVKKSSQSKRLSKRREKEKKKVPDGDNNRHDKDNNIHEDNNANHADTPEDKPKPKKKVTLEGLILSGREALAADGGGDVSDSEGDGEEEEEDSRGFHQYRAESVRAALAVAPGHIPDAALIHAARKTRQQARELGDFVPVPSEAPAGARLVREGDGDDSADDEDGRIIVRGLDLPSDKPKRGTAAVQSDEEINSEAEEWEEQQIKKAMPALPDITGDGIEVNPFSVAPPPPRLEDAPAHLRPLAAAARAPASAPDLVEALRHRLDELQTARAHTTYKKEEIQTRLLNAARVRESRGARTAALDTAYKRAQAARGYLTDLIECLDEKMPALEALESRALALHRRRCSFLVERRRADVRDQAQDVMAGAGRPGAVRAPDSEEKVRRTAEREGRRRARRLRREAGGTRHHRDGDSSDDDLPPAEAHHYRDERESIRAAAAALFADALPAWRSLRGVCARLAAWRRRAPASYVDAHAPAAAPRLLAPYVRHQLILWNPLADEDNEDYEKMDWYKWLMMYGVSESRSSDDSSGSEAEGESPAADERATRDDPDLLLVPTMLNKVVLPKITELVEHAWDPMCVRACVRLRHAVVRLAGVPHAARPLRRLAAAVRARLDAALSHDVFLPALPPQVMEGSGGAFWRRCAGGGVRLLRGALALTAPPPLLRADAVVTQLIERLSCAAGAAPGPWMAQAAAALAETLPRSGELRAAALRRLAALATLALSRLDSHNPLHLKALEQARAVIAEAKAME